MTLENERKSLLRRSHAVLPSHISQVWGGSSTNYGEGHQPSMGGVINQLWGGHQPSMGGVINQLWGGHQPSMGGVISQVWGGSSTNYGGGGIFPPVCTGSQNPENYFSNTYVLPSVNRTAGPISPRPIPKRQPKRQNFKAAAAARCVHGLKFNHNHVVRMKLYNTRMVTVVDPGFPRDGCQWGGRLTYYSIWHDFCHKLHENEKKTEIRGNARGTPRPCPIHHWVTSVSCQRSQ